MSRTYRRGFLLLDCNCGAPIQGRVTWNKNGVNFDNIQLELQRANTYGQAPNRKCRCGAKYDYYSKRNIKRDIKPWGKPPKWYKQMHERQRRAKDKDALRHQKYDCMPVVRNTYQWDWS